MGHKQWVMGQYYSSDGSLSHGSLPLTPLPALGWYIFAQTNRKRKNQVFFRLL